MFFLLHVFIFNVNLRFYVSVYIYILYFACISIIFCLFSCLLISGFFCVCFLFVCVFYIYGLVFLCSFLC